MLYAVLQALRSRHISYVVKNMAQPNSIKRIGRILTQIEHLLLKSIQHQLTKHRPLENEHLVGCQDFYADPWKIALRVSLACLDSRVICGITNGQTLFAVIALEHFEEEIIHRAASLII